MSKRHLIISRKHSRATAVLRSVFMGWGLVFVMIMAVAPLIYRSLLWANLEVIDLSGIQFDQFRIRNGDFAGLDSRNNPFSMKAAKIWQTYDEPDIIRLQTVRANVIQNKDDKDVAMDITSDDGEYTKSTGLLVLTGNVKVDSDDGDKVRTKRMTIQLRN
ncbi:MAG: LPS export ABC transporter periplasmic protein LptC [Alphaproteobacteria bacterium]|nr:LPS export ABC transporter periplasmic protein LptC [Alphaproteobacteria bacterium]